MSNEYETQAEQLRRACFQYRTAIRYLKMMIEEGIPKEREFHCINQNIDSADKIITDMQS